FEVYLGRAPEVPPERAVALRVASETTREGGLRQGLACVHAANEPHEPEVNAVVDQAHTQRVAHGATDVARVGAQPVCDVGLRNVEIRLNCRYGASSQRRRLLEPRRQLHELFT